MSLNSRLKEINLLGNVVFKLHPETYFAVSCHGEVIGRTGRVIKHRSNGRYKMVAIQIKRGRASNKYIHRLVAETWIPNPESLPEVNHKDGNRLNNLVSNLEWVSRKTNAQHAIQSGLIWNIPKRGQRGFQCKN